MARTLTSGWFPTSGTRKSTKLVEKLWGFVAIHDPVKSQNADHSCVCSILSQSILLWTVWYTHCGSDHTCDHTGGFDLEFRKSKPVLLCRPEPDCYEGLVFGKPVSWLSRILAVRSKQPAATRWLEVLALFGAALVAHLAGHNGWWRTIPHIRLGGGRDGSCAVNHLRSPFIPASRHVSRSRGLDLCWRVLDRGHSSAEELGSATGRRERASTASIPRTTTPCRQ
jgi:hypothetical protein